MNLATKWIDAYIGLGSNLNDPVRQIGMAHDAIKALPEVELVAFSPLYDSRPRGPEDQPNYVNAVMHLKTSLSAVDLLTQLQRIENMQGRTRSVRWGARTLDLDILLYGQNCINLPDLKVPHPEMPNRNFVLYPLVDISSPDLPIPGFGRLADLLANCSADGLTRIHE